MSKIASQRHVHGLDAPFWASLEEGVLRLPSCTGCGRWIWPVQHRCAGCGAKDLTWTEVALAGHLFTWTRTWYPFMPARAEELPATTVVVEFPSAGHIRLMGGFEGSPASLVIGCRVTGRIAAPAPTTLDLPSLVWAPAP
jgi:uncharacterized OB-fold protein